MKNYDLIIIGAGAGGLSIAAVAAPLGLKVALIEQGKMGGDCLNDGCVPSKALIAAARSAHDFLSAGRFGIEPHTPTINFKAVMKHVADVIKTIAPNDSVERFTSLGVDVYEGHATFAGSNSIQINDEFLQAKRIIIATGSSPFIPPIPGLENTPYHTNETIFTLEEKPEHLLVIGGGPIGCELAQAFRYLGVEVTILEAFTIMPKDEADLVDMIRHKLTQDGIHLFENININQVEYQDNLIKIIINSKQGQQTIIGSHLLVATGRRANVTKLQLEKANIKYTEKGIHVDTHLRTSNKRVYAIGDATGGYQFTHIANYHAGIVIKNVLFKMPARVDYTSIPWVTYTSPELAHTGLTEQEAKKIDANIEVIVVPFSDNDRAQTERQTLGKIKVIVNKKGKIYGCSILGPHAGELILPWIMLVKAGKTLRDLTDTIIPYPTLNEISKRAASQFYAPKLFSIGVKKLVRWLKWFN